MKKATKKSVMLAAGSALVGGLGVGVVAVGSMAHADSKPAIEQVIDSGASGASGADGVDGSSGLPGPLGRPDRAAHLESVLGPLVTDGTITQAQADKVIDAIDSAAPGRGDPSGGKRLEIVATALGITIADLRTELGTTKSVADVAKAHSVDVQTVIDALVAEATKKIDAAVTDGRLTAVQAATAKSTLVDRITKRVNAAGFPGRGPGGPGRRGGMRGGMGRHGGMRGDTGGNSAAPSDAATAAPSA